MPARSPFRAVRGTLRVDPVLIPAVFALIVFVVLAQNDGGFSATDWYAGGLLLLLVLVLCLVTLPARGRPSRVALLGLGLLAGFTLWSWFSITWADQNADAWDGANRTALYVIVFALFALWPMTGRGATLLVGAIGLAVGALALVALFKVSSADSLRSYFVGGRLAWPVNYPNGSVAIWFVGFWPCVTYAVRRELHPAWRGTFAFAAVILAGTGLLGESRGWLFAMPFVIITFLVLSPARLRTAWGLILVGLAVIPAAGPLLDVATAFGEGRPAGAALDDAVGRLLTVAVLAGFASAAAALVDRRARPSADVARKTGVALTAVAAAVLVIGIVAFVARVGDPVAWTGDRWDEFKGGAQPRVGGDRFTQTLGSNRYDFWRVGLNQFEANPITGAGADNFRHDYLLERRSDEEPYFPHSMVVRTLSQTGLVGVILLFGAFAAMLIAATRAIRRRGGLGSATAAAATTSFMYFLIHGSVDWFWELPALGMLAFALIGTAVALEPRAATRPGTVRARRPLVSTPAALAVTAVVAGLVLMSYAAPWLSARANQAAIDEWRAEVRRARADSGYRINPNPALDKLDRADGLNPFSAYPRLLTGQINVRLDRTEPAIVAYEEVLERDPRDQYTNLALAALASEQGRDEDAARYARRAAELSPRDDLARDALRVLREGGQLKIEELNRSIDSRTDERLR